MARPLKILFCSSEVNPFSKTGGLADVSGSLPDALSSLGCDIRVITPFYKSISESNIQIDKKLSISKNILSGPFDILEHNAGLPVYFVKKDKYFLRDGLYGSLSGEHPDNAMRFSFFSRAIIASLKELDFFPDIIHCNDWHTALVPLFVNNANLGIEAKTLITIHNIAYQGAFESLFGKWKTGIPKEYYKKKDMEIYGKLNYLKTGIVLADHISTVSRRYAHEILTPEFGCGLDKHLIKRSKYLSGIPNGVDYDEWSPEKDVFIKTNYGVDSLEKKMDCKVDLLREAGLPVSKERPLIGYVGRLAYQKGIDLMVGMLDKLLEEEVSIIILGEGDLSYNRLILDIVNKHPGKITFCNEFNDGFAHKVEAGSDIFMMPSRYEPCGLNQMYSIRYGTIPVVRATGGLDDVIVDCDADKDNGNGFKFGSIQPEDFLDCMKRALLKYSDKEEWNKLMIKAMSCDFSWDRSAGEYIKLYEKILSEKSK